jgi:hypothetical protein
VLFLPRIYIIPEIKEFVKKKSPLFRRFLRKFITQLLQRSEKAKGH